MSAAIEKRYHSSRVQAARNHMRINGWTSRDISKRFARSEEHISRVLTGHRESKKLIQQIMGLPENPRVRIDDPSDVLRPSVSERQTMPHPDHTETLLVNLDAERVAVVKITIEQEGIGLIDPPTHHAPTLTDLHHITEALSKKQYRLKTK